MTTLTGLTTEQKQMIVDGLQIMLNKVVYPTAKYIASTHRSSNRDAIKVVEIGEDIYQIHPIINGNSTDGFFTISVTITKGSMAGDPVSTFSEKFTSYDDVESKLEEYKKEILA